jgi:hypothetical protein
MAGNLIFAGERAMMWGWRVYVHRDALVSGEVLVFGAVPDHPNTTRWIAKLVRLEQPNPKAA